MSKELGRALRTLRKNCGLTQKQVAETLHIDRSTYAYYEGGATEPDLETISILANIYKVPVACLLPGTDGTLPIFLSDVLKPRVVNKDEDKLDIEKIYALAKDERGLVAWYRTLSDKKKEKLKAIMNDGFDSD